MAERLLVLMPYAQTHAPRSILEQARNLGPDVTEMRAIKHTMELALDDDSSHPRQDKHSAPCAQAK